MKRKLILSFAALLVVSPPASPSPWPGPSGCPPGHASTPSGSPPGPASAAAPAAEDAGLYCKEHGVPEKFCTLCHEELKETLMLCKEHGNIPEDICTLCHPEVEKKYNIEMCPKGHGLPEALLRQVRQGALGLGRPARRRLVCRPRQARGPVPRVCRGPEARSAAVAAGDGQGLPPALARRSGSPRRSSPGRSASRPPR